MGKNANIIMDNIQTILRDEKKKKIIVIIGILLIIIIFISEILPDKPKSEKTIDVNKSESYELEEYEKKLKDEIFDLVKHIDGVGRVKVMVTLENSEEILYQYDSKVQSTQDSQDKQEEVVIVDDENGNKQALVRTKKLPKIMGIVVVCDGAEDIDVEYRIVDALTTAFNINSSNVSVVLHSKSEN